MDEIQIFIEFFRDQLALVRSFSSDPAIYAGCSDPAIRVAMHRKILYSAMLDGLAGIRYYGEQLGNRKRFVRFLLEHTAWEGGHLVSSAVLRKRLKVPSPLRDHLDARLGSRSLQRGNALALTELDDPDTSLGPLATNAEIRHLEECQHFSLFYKYRNFIIHEFREPGHAMETFADGGAEPLYHGYINATTWHLLYPVGFFEARTTAAIESLEQWFKANRIDPSSRVPDSSEWLA